MPSSSELISKLAATQKPIRLKHILPVDCFFCSGHLPCRVHKPHVFDDVDLEMWIMGELSDDEFFERES